MSHRRCAGCGQTTTEDSLTSDGLCFSCDTGESLEFIVDREHFDRMIEQLATVNIMKGKDSGSLN